MYQDELVCILKPDDKKGIIILTNYKQPPNMYSLCISGLKTGQQLSKEGVDFGRSVTHPYIFFRAPYYSDNIDYTSVETEITSSYGTGQIGIEKIVYIRVDPDKTFVFSSEIRPRYNFNEISLYNSKKTLTNYLEIIKNNIEIEKTVVPNKEKIMYNLFTSKETLFPIKANPQLPFDDNPINRNSEILVSIPHLTPDFFVLCTQ
jgi:hypothetical protein